MGPAIDLPGVINGRLITPGEDAIELSYTNDVRVRMPRITEAHLQEIAGNKPRLLNGEQLPTGEYKFAADTGPCVLPDDRVVSTWAQRIPGKGVHELKVTDLAGRAPQLLLADVDVVDNGIGCSR